MLVSPAAVLPLMLERVPGVVSCRTQHHPRLAQHWIRAREAIVAAGDAGFLQARWLLLATRKE